MSNISKKLFFSTLFIVGFSTFSLNAQDDIISSGDRQEVTTYDDYSFSSVAERNSAVEEEYNRFSLQPNILTVRQAQAYCEEYGRIAAQSNRDEIRRLENRLKDLRDDDSRISPDYSNGDNGQRNGSDYLINNIERRINNLKNNNRVDSKTFMYCMGSFVPFVVDGTGGGQKCSAEELRWSGTEKDGKWMGCIGEAVEAGHMQRIKIAHDESLRGDDEEAFTGNGSFICRDGEWEYLATASTCTKVPKVCNDLDEVHEWGVTFPSWAVDNPSIENCEAQLEEKMRTGYAIIATAENNGVASISDLDSYNFDQRYVAERSKKTLYCFDGSINDQELVRLIANNPSITEDYLIEKCHYDPKDCGTETRLVGSACNIEMPVTAHEYIFEEDGVTENGNFIDTEIQDFPTVHGIIRNAKCFDGEWDFSDATEECHPNPVCGSAEIVDNFGTLSFSKTISDGESESDLRGEANAYFDVECSSENGTLQDDFSGFISDDNFSATRTCMTKVVDPDSNFCIEGTDDGNIVETVNPINGETSYVWVCESGYRTKTCSDTCEGDECPVEKYDCKIGHESVTHSCDGTEYSVNFPSSNGFFGDSYSRRYDSENLSCTGQLSCNSSRESNMEIRATET